MTPRPAVPTAISFVDCINRRDVDGLARLMTEQHRLEVFDATPVAGREANVRAWRGYFDAYPRYLIWPRHVAGWGEGAAILGHTTGSHLRLPDDRERAITLIWVAHAKGGALDRWRLIEDTAENRVRYGLGDDRGGWPSTVPITVRRGSYTISTDPAQLDVDAVHAYLSRSYWAQGIPRETVARSLSNSLCFAVLDSAGAQVGLARMVTDATTFAYLCDVYVLEEHRGSGLGK